MTDDAVVATGGSSTTAATVTPHDSTLAFTGFDAVRLVAVALALLGVGTLLTGLGRRPRRH
jgi:hypothetical protein